MKYLFGEKLIDGTIKSRPNRFIMLVEIKGVLEKCHCPSTGKIGNIIWKDIPCLLSKSKNETRKTKFTVEAFKQGKEYIGINQTKANEYIGFFLKNNLLPKMIKVKEIRREVKLNNSRIDFMINNKDYLEVKMPLKDLPFGEDKKKTNFISFDRLVKHFSDISETNNRKIFLMCFMYEAKPFQVPENPDKEIIDAAKHAHKSGVENWQINLKIEKEGVSLLDYFKLNLFE